MVPHELCETTAAECVRPHSEGENLFALIAMADEHPCLAAGGFQCQLLDKPALADPGLTDDRHDAATSGGGFLKRSAQASHLGFSPDEGCLGCTELVRAETDPRCVVSLRCRLGHSWFTQAFAQSARRRVRGRAQLPLQDRDARVVLLQRVAAPPLPQVEPDQGPVHALLKLIDGEKAKRCVYGMLQRARGLLPRELLRERALNELTQACPLNPEPVLEWR